LLLVTGDRDLLCLADRFSGAIVTAEPFLRMTNYRNPRAYHNLGSVAQETRQYEAAERYYQQALEIKIEYGDRYTQASTYNQLASLAVELENIPEARTYLQQAMTIFVEFGDEHSIAIVQRNLDRLSEGEAE
jgi:tetratricopeptide (TPR) repeat protein